jgi:hypothetical protein
MGDDLDAMRWRAGDIDRITEQADRVHKLNADQRGGADYFGGFARDRRQQPPEETPNDEAAERLTVEIHDDVVLSEEAQRMLKTTPPPEPKADAPGDKNEPPATSIAGTVA